MRTYRLLRAMTLITPPMSYDLVRKSLQVKITFKYGFKYKNYRKKMIFQHMSFTIIGRDLTNKE